MSLTTPSDRNSLPADAQQAVVFLPDASFLLYGEFERVGFDLVITNPAGEQFVVEDYFAMASPPTLMIAGGAGLTPDMVSALMPDPFDGVMFAGPASAGGTLEKIGTVRFARGDVEITDKNGDVRTVGRGDPVFEGDRIETGDRSFIRISMDDGTRFNLGKNAEATLDNFEYDKDAGVGNFEAMVRVGGFEYKSGDIGEMNPNARHSTIKTPSAFIGIRGSELEGSVDPSGQTIIIHRSGILEITDINGENPVVLTEPGNTSVIVMNGSPTFSSEPSEEQLQVLQDNLPPPDTGEDEVDEPEEDSEEDVDEQPTGDEVLSQQPSEPDLSDANPIDSGEADISGDSAPEESEPGETDTADGGDTSAPTLEEPTDDPQPEEEVPPDNAPIANPDSIALQAGESVDLSTLVLSNDEDPDANQSPSLSGVDNTGATGNATLVDGVLTYTASGFEGLAEGETGTDTFTYQISSGGLLDTAQVTVTVTGVNDPPLAVDDTASTDENTAVAIPDVLANDVDVDGDALTLVAVDVSNTTGSLVANGDGTFTYDPNGQFDVLTKGETATDSFSYVIGDGNGEIDTATVTITINGVNELPLAVADTATTTEDTTVVTGNVLANDSDPDGDTLSVLSIDTSLTTGLVTNNGDGTFSYNPNGQFESLAVGATATDSFTYTVSDGAGGTATASVTVTVNGANDAPVASVDTGSAPVGRTTLLNVLANDTDIDGDTLSTSTSALSELSATLVDNPDGTISYTTNPLFDELDPDELSFADTLTYTAIDPSGATSTASVTVNIGPDTSVPNAVDDNFSTLPFTNFVTGNVLTNDFGGTGTLTVQDFDTRTSFGSPVIYNGDGTFTVFPTSRISFESEVPQLIEEPFEESFEYTVVDDAGQTSTAEISVTVSGFDQISRTTINTATTFNGDLADTNDLFLNQSSVDVSGTGNSIAGYLLNLSNLQVASASDLAVGEGIDNEGSLVIDGLLTLGSGLMRNSGSIEGLGTVDVSNAAFLGSGRIAPGNFNNNGTLTIVGDPADPDAVKLTSNANLEMEITDLAGFDQLAINGAAHLDGNVRVFPSFEVPAAGDTFDIITTTDGYTGQIRNFELPVLFNDLVINPVQDGTNVTLELVQPTTISDGLGTIVPDPNAGQGEVVLGTPNADIFDLTANAAGDSFYGDSGSDTFIISDLSFSRIDGGGALGSDGDTIRFATASFDLRNVSAYQIDSVDILDMRDGQAGTLQLTADSALNINDILTIRADPGDHIVLDAARAGFVFQRFDINFPGQGDMFLVGGVTEQGDFASVLVSPNATVQINESGGDIWHLGSINADVMSGGAADEYFSGREGDDQIVAGAGDDTIFYDAEDLTGVDGGDGFDTLVPDASRMSLPMDLTASNPYTNFEFIDLHGEFRGSGESNTLTLDMADVAQMGRPNLVYGDGTTQLIIEGSVDDYVILNGQNLREGDPAGLVKETDPRFPDFVSFSDGANRVLVEAELLGPGVNHAPVAEPDEFTTTGTKTIILDPLANDRDPDPGDTVSISAVPATTDQGVSLIDNGDGTFDYDPTVLEPGSSTLFDGFEYTIVDSNGETSTGFVQITIEGNTPPEVPFAPVQGLGVEDTAADTFTVDLLATAFDADGDALSVQNIQFDGDTSGITVDGNTLVVDPSHPAYQDVSTTVFVNYEVVDGFGGTSTAAAEVLIAGPAIKLQTDGDFGTATNWDLQTVPGNGDTALIPAGFTATSVGTPAINALGLGGALSINDGSFNAFRLIMEAGSNLSVGAGLTFTVRGGARLDANSSITGGGKVLFQGGTSGESPNITMLDGYTVDGASWQWSGDLDVVGGSFAIGATGEVTHGNGFVVVNTTDFSNAGDLVLDGNFGSPVLHLHSGLQNTGTLTLDNSGSASTTVTVDVFGGELVNQGTIVSQDSGVGAGTRKIQGNVINESQINVNYDLTIDTFGAEFFNSPAGTISVSGGQTLTFIGNGNVFNEGTIDGTLGTGNTLDVTNVIFNNEGGTIQGFATINGTVTGGTVIPGNSPGLLEINGDYINSEDSVLEIELEGDGPGVGYDQVVVSGKAELDGRLNVSLLSGFMPAAASGFVILMADSLEGSFAQASGLDISDEQVLDLNYVDDQVELVSLAVTESGTDGSDALNGTGGQDVLVAGVGDDVITNIGGDDIVYGQDGNDTFQVHGEFKRIDGGDGIDTLELSDTVDLGNMDAVAVDNIEVLSLENGRADTLELDSQTIKGMVDGHNELTGTDSSLVLMGDSGDLVKLNGDFAADGEQTLSINGTEVAFRVFTEGDVSLYVDDAISLEIHRSDGSVETIEGADDQPLGDSIDMSGLDALVAGSDTSYDSPGDVSLVDLLDDGSDSLDGLLGEDGGSNDSPTLPVIDPYAGYVPTLGDPLGSTSLGNYQVEV